MKMMEQQIKNARRYQKPYVEEGLKETQEERIKRKRSSCAKCKYSSRGAGQNYENPTYYTCDYILIEGHSRGCSQTNCDKFEEEKGKRKRRWIN